MIGASDFAGTQWTHAAGFTLLTVVSISTSSIILARVARRKPTLKHGVLLSALVSCLLAPLFGIISGASHWQTVSVPVAMHSTRPVDAIEAKDISSSQVADATTYDIRPADASLNQTVTTGTTSDVAAESLAQPTSLVSPFSLQSLLAKMLAVVWLLGSGLLTLFALRSYRRGRLIRHSATTIETEHLKSLAIVAQQRVGLRKMPNIFQSSDVSVPVVHGCRRPIVMLPAGQLESLSNSELSDILVHEFAHIRRRGTLVVATEAITRAMFWPIPMVHIMIRQLGRAREEVCDNFVLSYRGSISYAETLYKIAVSANTRTVAIPSVGILHWRGSLEHRIAALLDPQRSRGCHLSSPVTLLIASLFVISSLVISGTRLVATEPPAAQRADANKPQSDMDPKGNGAVTPSAATATFYPHTSSPAGNANESEASEPKTRPITVRGVAKDADGKPIANAEIHLISSGRAAQEIDVTISDVSGDYCFENAAMPVDEQNGFGTIEVFGIVEGYGFTWHGTRHVYSGPRPASLPAVLKYDAFYEGDAIKMDLIFPPSAKLFGRFLDNNDRPVVGAQITLINLDNLDTEGRPISPSLRQFRVGQFLPNKVRVGISDEQGNFTISGLPKGTVARATFSHPHHAMQVRFVAITDRDITEHTFISGVTNGIRDGQQVRYPIYETSPVSTSPVEIRMAKNRSVSIHVVDEQQKPIPDVRVIASSGDRFTGMQDSGETDAEGLFRLALPPGQYDLRLSPDRTTDRIPVSESLTIQLTEEEQQKTVAVPRGCVLFLKTIDADSGKPIRGVRYWQETNENRGRMLLQSSTLITDNPVTDDDGQLRAVVMPGTHRFWVESSTLPKDYSMNPDGREIECKSGSSMQVTFELHKQDASQ